MGVIKLNAKQLITLWYSSIILLLAFSIATDEYSIAWFYLVLVTLVIITALFLITFSDYHKPILESVKRHVFIPFLSFVILICITVGSIHMLKNYYIKRPNSSEMTKIELFDSNLIIDSSNRLNLSVQFSGRVYNRTNISLNYLKIKLKFFEINLRSESTSNHEKNIYTIEDLENIAKFHSLNIQSLSELDKKLIGRQIQTLVFDINFDQTPPDGVTSIKMNNYIDKDLTRDWVWDFEILDAGEKW